MKLGASRAARRYARALIALADRPQLEAWGAELEHFARTVEAPELAEALKSPEISHEARLEAAAKIAERLDLSFPVRSFVLVVVRHGRLDEFGAIARAYGEQVDRLLNRARATLTFARDPSKRQVDQVVAGLAAMARKTIIPTVRTDPALLGGVVAELLGRTYDGSLSTRLEQVRLRLNG